LNSEVAVDVLEGDQLGPQVEPHPLELQRVPRLEFGLQGVGGDIRGHQGPQGGGVEKGFFVAVHDGFTAHLEFPDPLADGDRQNRRGRGLRQLLTGLVGYVRAIVQAGFARCQVHGEGKAGGHPALLAVGFGQKFENLNTG
jgi:hypothetical protein